MTEPAAYGRSYGEIVVRAFRKNVGACVALGIALAMIAVACLTPLLANDRPYVCRGTLPGEYRKAFNQLTRGAFMQILTLPARLCEETSKFKDQTATYHEFLRRVSEEDTRALYPALERLRKRANQMPEIRGLWASGNVPLREMAAEMTPDEKALLEAAVRRVIADLPRVYRERRDEALSGVALKLRELADQREDGLAAKAREIESRFRKAAGGDREPALRAVLEEVKATFDPEKAVLVPRTRFPLFTSLDGLDLFAIASTLLTLLAFGPLTWWKLRHFAPLERRWLITWAVALVPSAVAGIAWEMIREGKFETVSYKRGIAEGSIVLESSTWPPLRYRYDEVPETAPDERPPHPPTAEHLFGTDFMGRDLLSRMLWGSRISLSIGFVSTALAGFIGVVVGALAGYCRGRADIVISRLIEWMICFPRFFLVLAVVAFLPPSIYYVMLALGLFGWMGIARLQRGEFYRLMGQDFVTAAVALGAGHGRVMFRHILPNALAPVLVAASFGIASAMLTESGLSFLGFGVQEPATSWGQVLYTGRSHLTKWWTFLIPGAAIFVAVTCYNLVGDAIRDAVDPRLKT